MTGVTVRGRDLPVPPVLVISDSRQAGRPLPGLALRLFEAGCRWFLVREKHLDDVRQTKLTSRIVELAKPFGATVLVSGSTGVCRAAGAHGVHLPASGDPSAARSELGRDALVGYSAHSHAELDAAETSGADYATYSPIFASPSKPGYGPTLGLPELSRASAAHTVPIVALGGVDAHTAQACMQHGAAGVAVMGEIMRAGNPEAVFGRILAAIDAGRQT